MQHLSGLDCTQSQTYNSPPVDEHPLPYCPEVASLTVSKVSARHTMLAIPSPECGWNHILTTMKDATVTSSTASAGGTPTKIIFPWLAVNSMPCFINARTPVASTVIVVPTPSVMAWISLISSFAPADVLMVSVAPNSRAKSNREGMRSIPIMV